MSNLKNISSNLILSIIREKSNKQSDKTNISAENCVTYLDEVYSKINSLSIDNKTKEELKDKYFMK
jgi:hypothetical protein